MKTQTMMLEWFNSPLVLREVEIPPLTEGQLLVQVDAAGVCGSDVHMWQGEDKRLRLPVIMGHEGVGTVVAVGGEKFAEQGEKLAPGDRVVIHRGLTCGECYYCTVAGQPWLCQSRKVFGINLSAAQPPYLNGCYAKHIVLEKGTAIFKITGAIDPAILVSATCSGSMAAHAFSLHKVNEGSSVLIQGPGPIGAYAVAMARQAGAAEIIVVGGSESRLKLCRQFGATLVLNRRATSRGERLELIHGRTAGRGVDMVLEATGDAAAIGEGLDYLRFGGAYLTLGFSQPTGSYELDFFRDIVRRNLKIQGIWVSGPRHTLKALRLVEQNPNLFAKMVTHRFPLVAAGQALEAVRNRQAVKAVLLPQQM